MSEPKLPWYVSAAFSTFINYVKSTIKNKDSKKAQALKSRIQQLRDVCDDFLMEFEQSE